MKALHVMPHIPHTDSGVKMSYAVHFSVTGHEIDKRDRKRDFPEGMGRSDGGARYRMTMTTSLQMNIVKWI